MIDICRMATPFTDRQLVQGFEQNGMVLIDTPGLSMKQAKGVFLGLERCFGSIIRDESTPEGWYEVSDKGEAADSRYLADTAEHFSLHTDRAFSVMPPPYMGLLCESAASSGGESLLADAAALFECIRREAGDDALARLFEPFYTLRRSPHEVQRPLFYYNDHGRVCFAYRGKDMATEVGFGAEFAPLVGLVEAFLNDPASMLKLPLEPGQVLVADHQRCLHGRTKFQGRRLLLRLYFSGRNCAAPITGFTGDEKIDRQVQAGGWHTWVSDRGESLPQTV